VTDSLPLQAAHRAGRSPSSTSRPLSLLSGHQGRSTGARREPFCRTRPHSDTRHNRGNVHHSAALPRGYKLQHEHTRPSEPATCNQSLMPRSPPRTPPVAGSHSPRLNGGPPSSAAAIDLWQAAGADPMHTSRPSDRRRRRPGPPDGDLVAGSCPIVRLTTHTNAAATPMFHQPTLTLVRPRLHAGPARPAIASTCSSRVIVAPPSSAQAAARSRRGDDVMNESARASASGPREADRRPPVVCRSPPGRRSPRAQCHKPANTASTHRSCSRGPGRLPHPPSDGRGIDPRAPHGLAPNRQKRPTLSTAILWFRHKPPADRNTRSDRSGRDTMKQEINTMAPRRPSNRLRSETTTPWQLPPTCLQGSRGSQRRLP